MFLLRNQQRNVERARKHHSLPPPLASFSLPLFPLKLRFLFLRLFLYEERTYPRLFHPFRTRRVLGGSAHERIRDDERRITRARGQRHVHGGKLRPRSHIHGKLAPRYSRSWYVGILNALHTVTCRRHCSLHPSRLHPRPTLGPPPTTYPPDRTSMLSLSIPSAIFSLNKIITPGQLSVPSSLASSSLPSHT